MANDDLAGVQGIETALRVLGGKWKILILWHLGVKTQRYSELRRLMPQITEKMLIQQLRELESDGIIQRTAYPTVPVRVDYTYTEYGTSLFPIFKAMCKWGENHAERGAEAA